MRSKPCSAALSAAEEFGVGAARIIAGLAILQPSPGNDVNSAMSEVIAEYRAHLVDGGATPGVANMMRDHAAAACVREVERILGTFTMEEGHA